MTTRRLTKADIDRIVGVALEEDAGRGDITGAVLIPPHVRGRASVLVKAQGVIAGLGVAAAVFRHVDSSLVFKTFVKDGKRVRPGDVVAAVSGDVAGILTGERVALNFLQRMSGIASLTARYVHEVRGTKARIADTRKTTPGLRLLEKYSVRMGGGHNHRYDLSDGVLIKDNHIAILRAIGCSLDQIVREAKAKTPPGLLFEVEVNTPEDAVIAARAGADTIMFDNMSPAEMKRAVSMLPKGVRTEASGGINLNTVRAAAEAGVDIISVGALTHSAPALDISLELEPPASGR